MRDSCESLRTAETLNDGDEPSEGLVRLRLSDERARDGLGDAGARRGDDRATDARIPTSPLQASPNQAARVSDTRELLHHARAAEARRVRLHVHRGKLPPFDPIERLRLISERESRIGMAIGLVGALLLHSAPAAYGLSTLLELGAFALTVRNAVQEDVRATFAVEVSKPPAPPPEATRPEPEPPKERPQPSVPKPPVEETPAEEPPAAPAQAGKVLTAAPDPSEPLDLTEQGFVTGEGDRFVGGVTASKGTSEVAVRDLNAKTGGVPGGKGTAPAPAAAPAPPKENLARPATPASTNWDDCGFPPEADVEQIDFMRVSVVVTVGTDGRAQNVTVLKDPGFGFGRFARQCAMRKRFNVGLDSNGRPVVTTTPPIVVRFTR